MIELLKLDKLIPKYNKSIDNSSPHQLMFGEEDIIDFFAYEGLKEEADYIEIDGQLIRTLFISGYPFTASSGWLDNLVQFNKDMDLSFHIHEVQAMYAIPKLHRKITELESIRRTMLQKGSVIGTEITDPLESAIELKEKIQRGQERLFQISIYICLRDKTLTGLNQTTKLLENTLSARLFNTRIARYQQIEALQSTLTRGEDLLNQKRNLDSSSTSLTLPFISSELVHEGGVLYGINQSNNSLVLLDRFKLHNANSVIFAQSGSGKSYTAKIEVLRQLSQGTKVIIIDPECEYKQLADSVKGTYIKLSVKSLEKINPLDPVSSGYTKDAFTEHIQNLTEILSLMSGGLSDREKAAIDKALYSLYKKQGKEPPILEELYTKLKDLGQLKLCERLEKYISGSLSDVFNAQTNINLDNRLIVFDTKDLPESLRQIMIMIISNFVQNQVKTRPEKRLLLIDEGWTLLEHEESARFVAALTRRARKYYLGVSIISQQANDFLKNEYGRAIVSQSSLRILMRQDTTTIKNVASEFGLSEYEQNLLLTCNRGDALIIADQNHVAVNVIASDKEHPLLTTDPVEIYDSNKK